MVPQRSILGPKLFILYVNDICNIIKILKFVLFADDTNIFCSGHDAMQLSRDISNELVKHSDVSQNSVISLKRWLECRGFLTNATS